MQAGRRCEQHPHSAARATVSHFLSPLDVSNATVGRSKLWRTFIHQAFSPFLLLTTFAQQKGSKAWTVLMTIPPFTFKKAASGLWSAFPFVSADRHLLMGALTAALPWTWPLTFWHFAKWDSNWAVLTGTWATADLPWPSRSPGLFGTRLEMTCLQFHFTDRIWMQFPCAALLCVKTHNKEVRIVQKYVKYDSKIWIADENGT